MLISYTRKETNYNKTQMTKDGLKKHYRNKIEANSLTAIKTRFAGCLQYIDK